jgi:hypothetical protein
METFEYPIIIIRNDDKEEFIHLSNGFYRTKWGILNNSISKTKFTFLIKLIEIVKESGLKK